MLKTVELDLGYTKITAQEWVYDEGEENKVQAQLQENFIEGDPEEKKIDEMVSAGCVAEDSEDDIEEIAHLCRQDYLKTVEKRDPVAYLEGCVGRDELLADMIAREEMYESE